MPETFQALVVTILAVLPGAVFVWAFEGRVGRWHTGKQASFSDRVLRFVGSSAAFFAVYAYPAWLLWTHYFHYRVGKGPNARYQSVFTTNFHLPGWFFLLPLAYFLFPFVLGFTLGAIARRRLENRSLHHAVGETPGGGAVRMIDNITNFVVGDQKPPRAWDYVFLRPAPPRVVVRIKLKGTDPNGIGGWVGGLFGGDSWASGYGENPQDLYLEKTFEMDQATGEFLPGEKEDQYKEKGSGLLVRWEEMEYIETFGR
jgi:Family of unknown function (DUF6338)